MLETRLENSTHLRISGAFKEPGSSPAGPERPRRGAGPGLRFRLRPFSHFHANTGCSKWDTRVARSMSSHSLAW